MPPQCVYAIPEQVPDASPAGCSKESSSKTAASEGPETYPLGYVEGLNDARTTLADSFNILPHV
jgi:hypothetical protein